MSECQTPPKFALSCLQLAHLDHVGVLGEPLSGARYSMGFAQGACERQELRHREVLVPEKITRCSSSAARISAAMPAESAVARSTPWTSRPTRQRFS